MHRSPHLLVKYEWLSNTWRFWIALQKRFDNTGSILSAWARAHKAQVSKAASEAGLQEAVLAPRAD
jgi:hypothetical protein